MAEKVERSLNDVTPEEIPAHFQSDDTLKQGPTISPELQTIITASVKNLMDAKQKELITQVNRTARRKETAEEEDEKEDDEEPFQNSAAAKKKARQRGKKGESLIINDSLTRSVANKREGDETVEGDEQESIRRCLPGQRDGNGAPLPAAATAATSSKV
jgi:hypothetical protein